MTPSLGLMIGLPIGILITVVLLAAFFILRRQIKGGEDFFDGEYKFFSWNALIGAFIAIVITAGAMYPYKMEYHSWTPVEGKVAEVSSRMLKDGDGMSERYVITFEDGRKRGCDDTRCSGIKPGDTINLTCKREWQFAGQDGWACNWAGEE